MRHSRFSSIAGTILAGVVVVGAMGLPAQAATTTNRYATATSGSSVDPAVRTRVLDSHLGSKCPTVLAGRDRMPIAICTTLLSSTPTIYLYDKTGSRVLASYPMRNASTNGTMPAYLDDHGWLVVINGDRVIWRVVHYQYPNGRWYLAIGFSAVLTEVIRTTDAVAGLQPDSAGRVWFATRDGVVGTVDTGANKVRSLQLRSGEHILRDLAASTTQIVARTDKAIYHLGVASNGAPRIISRRTS